MAHWKKPDAIDKYNIFFYIFNGSVNRKISAIKQINYLAFTILGINFRQ